MLYIKTCSYYLFQINFKQFNVAFEPCDYDNKDTVSITEEDDVTMYVMSLKGFLALGHLAILLPRQFWLKHFTPFITSRISNLGNRIGHTCLCICLCAFVKAMFCATSMIESFTVAVILILTRHWRLYFIHYIQLSHCNSTCPF